MPPRKYESLERELTFAGPSALKRVSWICSCGRPTYAAKLEPGKYLVATHLGPDGKSCKLPREQEG